MSSSINTNTNLAVMKLKSNKKTGNSLECAICYKSIHTGFFQCSSPCGKLFHQTCMIRCMDETVHTAYQNDTEVEQRCCYCRRGLNTSQITLQIFARELDILHATGCYDVTDALDQVYERLNSADAGESAFDETGEYIDGPYDIYSLFRIENFKKPKQPKNAEFKKNAQRNKKINRIVIKQNIGGRRR